MRNICIVHHGDMGRNVTVAHPKPLQANDLIRKIVCQDGLAFSYQLWLKTALTVLGCFNIKGANSTL